MSLKVKLISCISVFMLMIGILIIGVYAATQQTINLKGSINYEVANKRFPLMEQHYLLQLEK